MTLPDEGSNFQQGLRVTSLEFLDRLNEVARLAAVFHKLQPDIERVISTARYWEEVGSRDIFIEIDEVWASGSAGPDGNPPADPNRVVVDDNGNPTRWNYNAFEVAKGGDGYGDLQSSSWVPALDPTGQNASWSGRAYNLSEEYNDGELLEGNGIDVTRLAASFQGTDVGPGVGMIFQPVPSGRVLRATLVTNKSGDVEAWFDFNNAIDGDCPPGTAAVAT